MPALFSVNNTIEIRITRAVVNLHDLTMPQWIDTKKKFLLHRTSWFSNGVARAYNSKFHKINGTPPFFHSLWPLPLASWQLHQRHDGPSLRCRSEMPPGDRHESRRTSTTKAYQSHLPKSPTQGESPPILGQNYTFMIRTKHFAIFWNNSSGEQLRLRSLDINIAETTIKFVQICLIDNE